MVKNGIYNVAVIIFVCSILCKLSCKNVPPIIVITLEAFRGNQPTWISKMAIKTVLCIMCTKLQTTHCRHFSIHCQAIAKQLVKLNRRELFLPSTQDPYAFNWVCYLQLLVALEFWSSHPSAFLILSAMAKVSVVLNLGSRVWKIKIF